METEKPRIPFEEINKNHNKDILHEPSSNTHNAESLELLSKKDNTSEAQLHEVVNEIHTMEHFEQESREDTRKKHFTTEPRSHTMIHMKLDTILIFLVNGLVGLSESLLGLRFFLKLLGASDQAPFVLWVYETSGSLLEPFNGMFPSPSLGRFFVLEFTTIFAMIVYAVAAFFVNKLIEFVYRQILIALQKPSSSKHSDQPHTDLT